MCSRATTENEEGSKLWTMIEVWTRSEQVAIKFIEKLEAAKFLWAKILCIISVRRPRRTRYEKGYVHGGINSSELPWIASPLPPQYDESSVLLLIILLLLVRPSKINT